MQTEGLAATEFDRRGVVRAAWIMALAGVVFMISRRWVSRDSRETSTLTQRSGWPDLRPITQTSGSARRC